MTGHMWWRHGKCVGMEPEMFDLSEGPYMVPPPERERIAKRLCRGCPVMRECAADAIVHRDVGVVRAGVWISNNRCSKRNSRSIRALEAVVRQGKHALR